jgi:hypothetical protein
MGDGRRDGVCSGRAAELCVNGGRRHALRFGPEPFRGGRRYGAVTSTARRLPSAAS